MSLDGFLSIAASRYDTETWRTASSSTGQTSAFQLADSVGVLQGASNLFTAIGGTTNSDTLSSSGQSGNTAVHGTWFVSHGGRTTQYAQNGHTWSAMTQETGSFSDTYLLTGSTTGTSVTTGSSSSLSTATGDFRTYTVVTTDSDGHTGRVTSTNDAETVLWAKTTVSRTFATIGFTTCESTLTIDVPTLATTLTPTRTTTMDGGHLTTTTVLAVSSFTTRTSYTYTNLGNTTTDSTSSEMVVSQETLTMDDGRQIVFGSPTYFVPGGQVAWIATGSDTSAGLRVLSDVARSATDSFTFPENTQTTSLGVVVITQTDTPLTFHPVGVSAGATGVVTRMITSTQTTTGILSSFDGISNRTTTGNITTFLTAVESWTTGHYETFVDTGDSVTAFGTSAFSTTLAANSTTAVYVETYDASGRPTGFATVAVEYSYGITAMSTLPQVGRVETSFTAATTGGAVTTGVTGRFVFEEGGVQTWERVSYGLFGAAVGGLEVLVPVRPPGVCLPDGAISDRLPHEQVRAGSLEFPAYYVFGQQRGLRAPFPWDYYTATDRTSGSWTVRFSGLSVTVAHAFSVGTSISTGSTATVLSQTNENDDAWWNTVDRFPASRAAFGGMTPDGREQKVLLPRNIFDITRVGNSSIDGMTSIQEATTVNNTAGDIGLVVRALPAYDLGWGGGELAILLPLYNNN